jgi:hypothetical protein
MVGPAELQRALTHNPLAKRELSEIWPTPAAGACQHAQLRVVR